MPSIIKELVDRNRLLGVLAGILIGALVCAWLSFAVLPAEVFFKGASPRLLKSVDPAEKTAQYRELYVVNIARRYQQGLGNPKVAFDEAANMLGLTSGDANKETAALMVQNALDAVKTENNRDKDGGYFNVNDELALAELLKGVNASAPDPSINILTRLIANRNLWLGLIGLVLAIPLILLGLGYLTRLSLPVNIASPRPAPRANSPASPRPPEDVIDQEAAALTTPPSSVTFPTSQVQQAWEEPAENEFGAPAASAIPTMDTFGEQEQVMDLPPAKPVTGAASAAAAAAVTALSASPAVIHQTAPPAQPASGGFVANYAQGDDMFDQDFAISGAKGELNGECGVSIADRLGADSPARVDALSVWVFDKADFKSVTKILATDHAMNTPAIRAKLAQKGEVIRATDNLTFDIITSRLHVVAHITDVLLNDDDPPNSYFKNARVNFIVQRKANDANVSM
jgi:hypothetical protein